ncbi:MAG: YceK/YidQ family lipoprotein [Kiritimatiellae bacterium]|nr:YceK/YidQ family lipoprotein [Kiritimatiellia bacterium]MDD4735613.1 YceK/YidQ family lipoprotein [Kiritimatiellia bacterium]
MKKILTVLLLICLLLAGCGTIMTLRDDRDPKERTYVYSGVRMDCFVVKEIFDPETVYFLPKWIALPFVVVDVPLSACADTVCLPYTIPKAISVDKKRKKKSL